MAKREKLNCKLCTRPIAINDSKFMRHTGIGDVSYWSRYGNMARRPSSRPICFGSYAPKDITEKDAIKRALEIKAYCEVHNQHTFGGRKNGMHYVSFWEYYLLVLTILSYK